MKINTLLLICFGLAIAGCSSDDSSGDTTETCETPTALTVSDITGTAANLSWTEMGSATTWDVEIVTAGTDPTGTPTEANVPNPYAATGLSAETDYEFYVRANCGDSTSDWAGPQAFTTVIAVSPKNYFPLAEGNSWSYANERTVQGEPATQSEETMTAGAPTDENGMMNYPMDTDNSTDGGLVTSVFANGTLHEDGDQMIYNGSILVSFADLQMDPVEIMIDNAVIFSETASAGTELFTYSGTTTQTVDLGVMLPITINYSIATTNVEFLADYTTPNGQDYQDVLHADLVISASVSTEYMGMTIEVMEQQDAVTTANYYANEVGMIYSNVVNNIVFEDLSMMGVDLPDIHIESSQELTAYTLN